MIKFKKRRNYKVWTHIQKFGGSFYKIEINRVYKSEVLQVSVSRLMGDPKDFAIWDSENLPGRYEKPEEAKKAANHFMAGVQDIAVLYACARRRELEPPAWSLIS